jgi:hypothetical protein
MRSALEATNGNADPQGYLLKHPKLAERYRDDAAFHAGFDSIVWARANDPVQLLKAKEALDERDPRLTALTVWAG